MFAMWWLMMAAMMLPSATPVLLLAAALNRRAAPDRQPYGATALFACRLPRRVGGFQRGRGRRAGLVERERQPVVDAARRRRRASRAALLLAAGLWQLTPLKRACLRHCRSPVHFLDGATAARRALGAFAMGAEHGAYCVGCCWLMMALLFVGGIMNLYWIAGLAGYALAEELLPAGDASRVSRERFSSRPGLQLTGVGGRGLLENHRPRCARLASIPARTDSRPGCRSKRRRRR